MLAAPGRVVCAGGQRVSCKLLVVVQIVSLPPPLLLLPLLRQSPSALGALTCLQGPDLLLLLFPWSPYAPSSRLQVAYDAHEEHGVTPIEWGERCALTLWFTDVPEHCEDSRLLPQLAGGLRLFFCCSSLGWRPVCGWSVARAGGFRPGWQAGLSAGWPGLRLLDQQLCAAVTQDTCGGSCDGSSSRRVQSALCCLFSDAAVPEHAAQ